MSRRYNGTDYKHEYIINPSKKTKEIVSHVKEHSPNYQQQEIEQYRLWDVPDVVVLEGTYGHLKDNVTIVASVKYFLESQPKPKSKYDFSGLIKVFKVLGIVWIISAIVSSIIVFNMMLPLIP